MFTEPFENWESVDQIDWGIVEANLLEYCRLSLDAFAKKHPSDQIYGIVARVGQNWDLDLYLNSVEQLAEQPAHFRKMSPSSPQSDQDDKTLQEELGNWAIDYWQYGILGHYTQTPDPSVFAHYDFFDELYGRLMDEEDEAGNRESRADDRLHGDFVESCARAAARLASSNELAQLNKTPDFEIRFYMEYQWDKDSIAEAQKSIAKGNCPTLPDHIEDQPLKEPDFMPRWKN